MWTICEFYGQKRRAVRRPIHCVFPAFLPEISAT